MGGNPPHRFTEIGLSHTQSFLKVAPKQRNAAPENHEKTERR